MVWDDAAARGGRDEPIELVGTHLRLVGVINLGRFGRLSDLINASSGYVRVHDARLLRRNGDPTNLVLPELMVDQDEISFIAQAEAPPQETGPARGFIEAGFGGNVVERRAREFVMFTPGHTVTGKIHVFGQTSLVGFVDSRDPRFVPVTDVTTRSLADRRIIGHYEFIVINRTQMIAAAEVGRQGDIAPEDVPDFTSLGSKPGALNRPGARKHPSVHMALDGTGWVGSNLHVHASPTRGVGSISRALPGPGRDVDEVPWRCRIRRVSSDVGLASTKPRSTPRAPSPWPGSRRSSRTGRSRRRICRPRRMGRPSTP